MDIEQLNERIDELTVQHGEMLGRVMSLVNTTIKLHDVVLTLQHENKSLTQMLMRHIYDEGGLHPTCKCDDCLEAKA